MDGQPTAQTLDATFQSVEKAIGEDPRFLWMPCQGAYDDYRYSACYLDDNVNLSESFQALMTRLETTGFKGAPSPTMDTELAAVLTKEAPASRLRVTYLGTVVEVVMDQPGVGLFGSSGSSEDALAGKDTYVRKDLASLAKQVYYNLLIRGQLSLKQTEESITLCKEEEGEGCFSAQSGITRAQFDEAFANEFFAGDKDYFLKIDRQPTFAYNEEPRLERKEITEPGIRVVKAGTGAYVVHDSISYPDLEARIEFREHQTPDLTVTTKPLPE